MPPKRAKSSPLVTPEIATRAVLNLREKLPRSNVLRREIERVMGLEAGSLEEFKDAIKPLCEKAVQDINNSLVEALQKIFTKHSATPASRRKPLEMDALLRGLETQFSWNRGDADFFQPDVIALAKESGLDLETTTSSNTSNSSTLGGEEKKTKENVNPSAVSTNKRQKTSIPGEAVAIEEKTTATTSSETTTTTTTRKPGKTTTTTRGKPSPNVENEEESAMELVEVRVEQPPPATVNPPKKGKAKPRTTSAITKAIVFDAINALSVAKEGSTVKVTPKEIRREIERSLGWDQDEVDAFKAHISDLIAQYEPPTAAPPTAATTTTTTKAKRKTAADVTEVVSDEALVDEYIVRRAVDALRAVSSAMTTKQVRRKVEELLSWETGRADAIKDRISTLLEELVNGERGGNEDLVGGTSTSSSSNRYDVNASSSVPEEKAVERAVEAALRNDGSGTGAHHKPTALYDVLREVERVQRLPTRALIERNRDAAEEAVARALDRFVAHEEPKDLMMRALSLCTPTQSKPSSSRQTAYDRAAEAILAVPGGLLASLIPRLGRHNYLAPPPPLKLHYVFNALVRAVASRRVLLHVAGADLLEPAHCVLYLGKDATDNKTLVLVTCPALSEHEGPRTEGPKSWKEVRSYACLTTPLELIDDFDKDLTSEIRIYLASALAPATRFILCGEYVVFTTAPLERVSSSSSQQQQQ